MSSLLFKKSSVLSFKYRSPVILTKKYPNRPSPAMGLPLSIVSLQLTSTVTSNYLQDLCTKTVVLEGSITVLSQPVQPSPNSVEVSLQVQKERYIERP